MRGLRRIFAMAAQTKEVDGNPTHAQIRFSLEPAPQSPRFAKGHVQDSPAGVTNKMVMGLRVTVITHRARGRRNDLHLPLAGEHLEVSINRPQGKTGKIAREA